MRGLRLLLFRFLPRRLAPILLVWEGFQLVQRFRRRGHPTPASPRRIRTAEGSNATTRGRGRGGRFGGGRGRERERDESIV